MKIDIDKTKSISLAILNEISRFADEMVELITFDDIRRNLDYMEGDPRRISNNIRSLERNGYVKIDRKTNSVKLTNKGQIKLIEKSTNNVTDGKWRMLSYDIPEDSKNRREQFCRSIRRVGFKQVQRSLWACPFVRADEIDLITRELGLTKYVAYLLVEKTDILKHLETLFKSELS